MKKKWWHEKIGYQIYPKSFLDTNGDGVGDLAGVIEKLPYLEQLGVDILWLSPVYPSPMVDNGYDISDYENIDPRFGTLEDMDRLIAEAKKKNISIIMDLVVNHCSDQHAWFQKAIADPKGPYGDYFYLKEGKDGKEPNNWRSYFGGSVWEKLPGQENLFYYHAYAKEQPDLKRPDLGRSSGGRAGRQRLFNLQHHPDAEARRRDEKWHWRLFKRIKGTLLCAPRCVYGRRGVRGRQGAAGRIYRRGRIFFHDVCL